MGTPPLLRSLALDVDPLEAAGALAHVPGTLLLHTQRPWHGTGRSALLFAPRWTLTARAGERPTWSGDVPAGAPPEDAPSQLPFALAQRLPAGAVARPCFAGVAGYLGYDLGTVQIGAARPAPPPFELPDAWLGAYDCALVFGPPAPPELIVADLFPLVPVGRPLPERLQEARDILRAAVMAQRALAAGLRAVGRTLRTTQHGERALRSSAATTAPPRAPAVDGLDPAWHRQAVERIQRHLRAGDVYQINLTGFATACTEVDPWRAFLHQATVNPVTFAAFLRLDDAAITCHSPERLLRLTGNRAESAPIKGTAPLATDDIARLLASDKDRAEHVMIVDLVRNDLGRCCAYGSVRLVELMAPLRLAGLVHLVSRIEGRVRPRQRAQLLADLFPGGSITGAPKRRATELIAQVERTGRGPYTGSIGYVDRAGNADWNIAIRTAVWQDGRVAFGCGGGIVLDSDPGREHEEAALKARSFFDSLAATAAVAPLQPLQPAHALQPSQPSTTPAPERRP
jgi:para-aminobenzoate synthetase component 1